MQVVFQSDRIHKDVIRSAHLDFNRMALLTGGEDSKLCLWQPELQTSLDLGSEHWMQAQAPTERVGGGRSMGLHSKFSPYHR
jgi:hypothetical protein